jgi:hypothetical protein
LRRGRAGDRLYYIQAVMHMRGIDDNRQRGDSGAIGSVRRAIRRTGVSRMSRNRTLYVRCPTRLRLLRCSMSEEAIDDRHQPALVV